ncbi:MAG: maleylpyruvate isomerase family mycothiol-dependent enzyme, partial [Actinobacteria bacterium]|nr:maleylpyruvate isomerase family mycothiol-dependent enzyme [Actinomycetota bacterium]
ELRRVGGAADPKARCPWYGPAMSVTSMLTARLMETWAHGQDICDALGVHREPTDRLRHIAHIGVRARPFSYAANRREMPAADVRVELNAPSGGTWQWGESATDTVRGDALGFCLVVTQRRHPDDCGLEVNGDAAREWMSIAQAFAGPPGEGRAKGQFD